MPKDKSVIHLFLAETKEREKDLYEQIKLYNQLFKVNVLEDYNLQFHCYQSAYRFEDKKFGLVCCDEIHDSLSPEYVKFYVYNQYDAILGLSATIDDTVMYGLKKYPELKKFFNDNFVSKQDMVDKIAPVCFEYTTNDGQKDGTSRKLNIYVVKNKLNSFYKNVKAGNFKNSFWQTEADAYAYATKMFNTAMAMEPDEVDNIHDFAAKKEIYIKKALHRRNEVLYNLRSKDEIIQDILRNIKGKTIIFGNHLESLERVAPSHIVSSKNSEGENTLIRKQFEEGNLNLIGSFKMLKQGANLEKVDNCIIKDYYSSEKDFIQRVGRLRKDKEKIGHVFVIVTMDTKEVDWFNKMVANSTEFNYILCNDKVEAVNQYKKYIETESYDFIPFQEYVRINKKSCLNEFVFLCLQKR